MVNPYEAEVKSRGVKAFLDFIIASILLVEPCGGYDILAKIHSKLGILLSPGAIYPTIHEMETERLTKTKSIGRKKVFSLTEEGKNMA
jgi:DNA-binding PadR family transcriptional regulator